MRRFYCLSKQGSYLRAEIVNGFREFGYSEVSRDFLCQKIYYEKF